ncbi:AMP-binding protein [Scytonema sp. NUACC21]
MQSLADYSSVQSLPFVWRLAHERFGQTQALVDPHTKPEVVLTYTQLYQQIQSFAAGLQALGVQPEANLPYVALFADNSPRWFIADQGIMAAGAINVVRGAQADPEELLFILADSASTVLVVENRETLKKLCPQLYSLPIHLVVLLSDEEPDEENSLKILNYQKLMAIGSNYSLQRVNQNQDTLATLMYTSGTGGKPKGVMLTHGNLLHQITTIGVAVQPQVGDRILSVLPTWHIYERSIEYFFLSQGCTQIYTNVRYFKQDLKEFKPKYMAGVPRLWESIYEGMQKQFREQPPNKQRLIKFLLTNSQRYIEARRTLYRLELNQSPRSPRQNLIAGIQTVALLPFHALAKQLVYKQVLNATGGQIQQVISGGSSLAMHLENFFEMVGFQILVGYGLTETSPVISVRRHWHNLRGSSGKLMPGTQVKIVDPETRQPMSVGQRGLILVRGPQIMQGYHNNPEATARAIDSEGWFDTGDLGWVTADDDLVLTGRAKDTIVLTNGENVEPQPLEDACRRSPYIDQIMLVGQDQRSLGALIVPNMDALEQWADAQNLSLQEIDLNSKAIHQLFRQELIREVQNRPGYRASDIIGPFKLILEPFSIDNGMMTQTMKIRRPVVIQRYRDTIADLFL